MKNLIPLQLAIQKQTKKETIWVVIITTFLFSIILCIFLYQNYVSTPNKMIGLEAANISRSFVDGDEYNIRNELSILSEKGEFCAVWLLDKKGYLISNSNNLYKPIIKNYKSDFSFSFFNSNFLLIRKFPLPNTDNTELYASQIIPVYYVLFSYLFLLGTIIILSRFLKKTRIMNYKLFIDPIIRLTKYIEKNEYKLENKEILAIENNNSFEEVHVLYDKINFFLKNLVENERTKIKLAEVTGVTNSIRMLAHDVRRPFSILNAGLVVLEKSENIDIFKRKSLKLKIELTNNLNRVTNMLNDFMNLGSEDKIKEEIFNFEEILLDIMLHSFYIDEKSLLQFEYNFTHSST